MPTLGGELKSVFTAMWDGIVETAPSILWALIILLIGYFVAWLIYNGLEKLLKRVKLDKWTIQETGLKKVIGKFKLSHFLSLIARWYVFILFFPPAAEIVELKSLESLLINLSMWIPNLIAAVIIMIIGILIANYTKLKIEQTSFSHSKFIGGLTRVIIIVFSLLIALEQVGINLSVATDSFLIILGGIVFALALGFGLGLRNEAEKMVKEWRKKL
ncbi:MAG: mechanosensitive ion channel family protein [Nanobdellota archaeon]